MPKLTRENICHDAPIFTLPSASWDNLLKIAVLGTGREQGSLSLDGPLKPFGENKGDAETSFLNAVAATIVSTRAGQLPKRSETPEIAMCRPETQPYFSARATSLLDVCLSQQRELMPQALSWAAQSGQIVPPILLPRLLELGRGSKELRRVLAPILGERGRWLAQLNPEWQHVAAPLDADLEASWQEGEIAARREALGLKREQDPTQARDWIQTALSTEGAKERAQWLEAMEAQLGPDDEPLFEAALDDKSKEVRAVAISLLEKLPTSRLVERAKAELEPLLTWNKTDSRLQVELPPNWKKAWVRDGLNEKLSAYDRVRNLGERASWLWNWLARVPPSYWQEHWQASPEQIVAGAPKEWRDMLLSAWWEAAKKQRDTKWCEALLAVCDADSIRHLFSFQNIAPEQADVLVLALWDKGNPDLFAGSPLSNLLFSHSGTWSIDIAQRFLKVAREEMRVAQKAGVPNPARQNWLRTALLTAGDKFPVEMAAESATGWPDSPEILDHWAPFITQFLARLQLRADLQFEFQI